MITYEERFNNLLERLDPKYMAILDEVEQMYPYSVAKIKNELANQVNKEGDKIRVLDNGELWFEIDNSFNLDEAEFYKTPSFSGLTNSTGAQGYFNSQKNTGWKVTPEFILKSFAMSQNQLLQFSQQISSHLKLIQEYRNENKAWRKSESKKIKSNLINGEQKTLFEYG